MNGPENTLVAVVEVDWIALVDVEACNWPITLMIPEVVELIEGAVFAKTVPVMFIVPIDEFAIAKLLLAFAPPITLPVMFIIPNEFRIVTLLLVAGPPVKLPVIFTTPDELLDNTVLLIPLPVNERLPIMVKFPF